MKRLKTLALLALMAVTAQAAGSHLITDDAYRAQMEQTFAQQMQLIGSQFYNLEGLNPTQQEREALQFLYAYSPIADVTDYSTAFYLDAVRATLDARATMPWGQQVPELLWRHFVLPLRVNNENLDSARVVLYRTLKPRIAGMTMSEAVLEVNHWCHEQVTYAPSDGRTLAPLACMVNALGRCGEESTFTVSALRAVGIPARQVYTPRWAHTDDNHAWVEAWADGQWHFLGACEPEPVLDLGWFNAPASRAMLTHTRAFGDYRGPEEVMLKTHDFTEINLTSNYAATAPATIVVLDASGKPVEGARVEFKIYNYGEFYSAVTKYTGAGGSTSLSAGQGMMLAWASHEGKWGCAPVRFGTDSRVTITLGNSLEQAAGAAVGALDTLDIVPPAEHARMPLVTPEMDARNKVRFAQEDSIRKAYEATFYPAGDDSRLGKLLVKARGNWRTIKAFADQAADKERALGLLESVSLKDLRDMPLDILLDSYNAASDQLCPRVENEMITRPYKQRLAQEFAGQAAAWRADPAQLVAWVKQNIRLNPDTRSLRIAQTPVGVLESKISDVRGRDIFTVALCRSLGIEARRDAVSAKVQYRQGADWVDVNWETERNTIAPTGTLVLDYQPTPLLDNPKYYYHFSISKVVDGRLQLLEYEEGDGEAEVASWLGTFSRGAQLDEGTYLLVSGTRMADGSVLTASRYFTITAGTTTTVPLVMRAATDGVSVIGNFNAESLVTAGGKQQSVLSLTGRGYYVLGVLGVGQEPTNHALNDIAKMAAELNQWGRPMVLLFESEDDARKFNVNEFGKLPDNVVYAIDSDGSVKRQIAAEMKLANDRQMPMFIIADTFNRVVFCSQGYTIGLGEQLVKVIQKL